MKYLWPFLDVIKKCNLPELAFYQIENIVLSLREYYNQVEYGVWSRMTSICIDEPMFMIGTFFHFNSKHALFNIVKFSLHSFF